MLGTILAAVIGGVAAIIAAWYTVSATKKAQRQTEAANRAIAISTRRAEKFRADGEAYDRAQRINEEIVRALRQEVERLQASLAALRVRLAEEENRSDALERQVDALQRSVNRMSALLAENNIPIPSGGN